MEHFKMGGFDTSTYYERVFLKLGVFWLKLNLRFTPDLLLKGNWKMFLSKVNQMPWIDQCKAKAVSLEFWCCPYVQQYTRIFTP